MEPARCSICGMYAIDEPGLRRGEWLVFVDHAPGDAAMLSHPHGLEYFCTVHLPKARELAHLTIEKAMAQLRAQAATAHQRTLKCLGQ